jgi:hypothetical protein
MRIKEVRVTVPAMEGTGIVRTHPGTIRISQLAKGAVVFVAAEDDLREH